MSRDRRRPLEPSSCTQADLCEPTPQALLSRPLCRARQQTTRSSPYSPSPQKLFKRARREPAYPASLLLPTRNTMETFPQFPSIALCLATLLLPLWSCMACAPLGTVRNYLSFQGQSSPYPLASPEVKGNVQGGSVRGSRASMSRPLFLPSPTPSISLSVYLRNTEHPTQQSSLRS